MMSKSHFINNIYKACAVRSASLFSDANLDGSEINIFRTDKFTTNSL
jgi:hypothetical protein